MKEKPITQRWTTRLLCWGIAATLPTGDAWPTAQGAEGKPSSNEQINISDYDIRSFTYPELKDFKIPRPKRVRLDNGLTVFLLEDHELPDIKASARIATGSVYEPAEKIGLASIVGTVMRTGGTETMSPDEINRQLEGVGATVETSIGRTSASASMSSLKESLDTVLPIFADILTEPAFAKQKVALAKSQEKSAISRRNDKPRQIAIREFRQLLYGSDSPYARVPQYFTIDRISRQDAVRFYEAYFHPNNTLLSVWGDFETSEMLERIRKAFGDWEKETNFQRPKPPEPKLEANHSVNLIPKRDVNQSTIFIGHPGGLTRKEPDFIPVTVMNEVLAGGFSGRLFENVRSEQGLAYSVFGRYTANYRRSGIFYAGAATKSQTTVEAIRSIIHEIETIRKEPPTQKELKLAKQGYLNSFVFKFDTNREILDRLMTYEYYDYPKDFLRQFKEGIETVTAKEVTQVAKRYLFPDKVAILVVGNPSEFGQELSRLGEVNKIDISIPKEPSGKGSPESSPEQVKQGRKLLLAVREALGGTSFNEITNLTFEATQQIETPRGTMEIDTKSVIADTDRIFIQQKMPQGTVTITLNGKKGTINTPRGKQSMPSSQIKQIHGELWRNLTFLCREAQHPKLKAIHRGKTEIDGQSLAKLEIQPPVGSQFTLFVSPKTKMPVRVAYQGRNMQGNPVSSVKTYEKYQTVKGIKIPHKVVTFQKGNKRRVTKLRQVRLNAELKAGRFETDE